MVLLEELTTEQQELLKQLRENLEEFLLPEHGDEYLLRFLVARSFDVPLATEMLRKHLLYWKRYGLNRKLSEFTLEKKHFYFFTTPLGFTNDGSLVRLLKLGQTDIKGLILSHTKHEAFSVLVSLMEGDRSAQRERIQEHGDGKDGKMVYIMDLKGLAWKLLFFKPASRYTSFMLGMYEANFPESLRTAYVLNAPGFFGVILGFLKKILPSEILSKVIILKPSEVVPVLGSMLDLSILPAEIGGTRTDSDGDPTCSSLYPVKPGTLVPQEYFLSTQENFLEKDPNAKKVVIQKQSTFSIPLNVDVPKSVLLWDFRTMDKDIAMSLRYQRNGKSEIKIRPQKIDCHNYTESGRYVCEEPGKYDLVFDNTYSWFSKKELMYKVRVFTPTEEEKYCAELMNNLSLKVD